MKPTTEVAPVRIWHVAILLALMAAQIGCGVWASTASSDTNRDIFFAQQIASGGYFPLTGPEINSMLHLGPLWYYILAAAVWLIPNAASVTGLMAMISASQFPLAYRLGRRFGSAREGLLFALALAIPGWMSVSLASMTHTIAIVPSLLLGVFAAQAYREHPDLKHAAWLGLASAFMFSAHPTLVLLAAFLVLWSALKTPTPRQLLGHGLVLFGLIALTLVPMLYEQWHEGLADVATTSKYTHTDWSAPSLLRAGYLLYAILDYGPKYVTRFWLQLSPTCVRLLFSVYTLVLGAASIGIVLRLITQPGKRGLIGVLFGLLLTQSIFVCAIRALMPPWMIYALWPLIAALVALGLEWFCVQSNAGRLFVAFGLLTTTLWTFSTYGFLASSSLDHAEVNPSPGKHGIMDVREYEKAKFYYRLARIPFRELFTIGEPLCEPVTLFGHYAYLVDYTYAVSAMADCGGSENVQFGGLPQPGRRALLGLHESVWNQIGMKPARWISILGITAPTSVWHSPAPFEPVVPRLANFPRKLQIDTRRFTVSGDAPPDQAVLVSHRAHRYAPFEVIGGHIDGEGIKPVYVDATAVVFHAQSEYLGKNVVHWDIEIEATADYVDVLTFASAH